MPINEQRNIAVAIGLGLSFDQYSQTLFIGENSMEQTIFDILGSDVSYDFNRFSTATLELPFEFRWRSSTPSKVQFWRIYAGARVGYSYWYRANFKQPNNTIPNGYTNFKHEYCCNPFHGIWVFQFLRSLYLDTVFEDAFLDTTQEEIGFRPLKLGIIFISYSQN